VRSFPAEANRRQRASFGRVVATVPGYAEQPGVRLAAGRFLDDQDEAETKAVTVLGAEVAERLFPNEEASGEMVRLGAGSYRVVGILREQGQPVGNLSADDVNRGVHIPLRTCARRFGERILVRQAGSRTAEAVPLTEVVVATRSPGQAEYTAACIAALLEDSHRVKDWNVTVGRSSLH
jgi:putative ABC transport system permease protein